MFPTLLLGVVLAFLPDSPQEAPPSSLPPAGATPAPIPSGPTKEIPSLFGVLDNPPPNAGVSFGLPTTLFPPPVDQAPKTVETPYRRALPSPWDSPPIPGSEYQGYPIIGVPPDFTIWPLMKELQGTYLDDALISNRIRFYGWVTVEGNLSTSKNTNTPDSYWIRPNNVDMDQMLFRFERNLDSVQTDHIDWGFRSTLLYGIDYRYMTAGGWFSDQAAETQPTLRLGPHRAVHRHLRPLGGQGMIVRIGRWIACPDIETQFAPDNYMGSHSLLFTFDTYTQTGIMLTFKFSDQWTSRPACMRARTWPPGTRAPCQPVPSASAGCPRTITMPSKGA